VDMEEAATELLLLARNSDKGWDRRQVGLEGPPGPIQRDTAKEPPTAPSPPADTAQLRR
jgi:hypothetical protein